MKKINKINLHKLSQAELAEKEQAMLMGGACGCIYICSGNACGCPEDMLGGFHSSNSNIEASGSGDDNSGVDRVWNGISN